ncbi:hypothetical protein, partial [Segatella copri]|uniref:hypothetical protein n=1 Tax=Segatella copri TaxID=165179 RepID=UPI00222E5C2E
TITSQYQQYFRFANYLRYMQQDLQAGQYIRASYQHRKNIFQHFIQNASTELHKILCRLQQ